MSKIPEMERIRFSFFRPEYSESLLEVVHLSRSEYSDRSIFGKPVHCATSVRLYRENEN